MSHESYFNQRCCIGDNSAQRCRIGAIWPISHITASCPAGRHDHSHRVCRAAADFYIFSFYSALFRTLPLLNKTGTVLLGTWNRSHPNNEIIPLFNCYYLRMFNDVETFSMFNERAVWCLNLTCRCVCSTTLVDSFLQILSVLMWICTSLFCSPVFVLASQTFSTSQWLIKEHLSH